MTCQRERNLLAGLNSVAIDSNRDPQALFAATPSVFGGLYFLIDISFILHAAVAERCENPVELTPKEEHYEMIEWSSPSRPKGHSSCRTRIR